MLWAFVQFGFGVPAYAQLVPLLEYTNIWRYHPNTNNPEYATPDAWTKPTFDDASWNSGRGMFGFETSAGVLAAYAPLNTIIPSPSAGIPGQQVVSSYFRTRFPWSGPTSNIYFQLSCAADDGMIAYLNGVEFFSFNMPESRPMTWDVSLLPRGNNPLGEAVPITADVAVTSLLPGDNVLAVELHQASLISGDDLFGMMLSAYQAVPPTTILAGEPRDQVVLSGRSFTLETSFFALPPPNYQWFEEGEPISGATNSTYATMNEVPCSSPSGGQRHFYCRVSNAVGAVNSRTATITFVTDVDPPLLTHVAAGVSNEVIVEFNEFVSPNSAEDPFNYVLRDASGAELELADSRLARNGSAAILTPTLPLREGAAYDLSVTANGVTDLCGLPVTPSTRSFVARVRNLCGGILFETFVDPQGRAGTGSSPGQEPWWTTFPDNPAEQVRLSGAFDSRVRYPTDGQSNYGGRMRALFAPPFSGRWRFFIRADDWGELWLNPDGPGANGRRMIAGDYACDSIGCQPFREPPAPATSAAFPLTAGQAYYLDARWSAGIGSDYCQVAARLEGDPTPAALLNPVPESWLAPTLAPGSIGSVVITQQPASRTVPEDSQAEFAVSVSTDVTVCYQWFRNGVAIPGANGPRYRFGATRSDEGHQFGVRIVVPAGPTLTSEVATLHILGVDVDGPRLLGVESDVDRRTLTLRWNDLLSADSAAKRENYQIDGVRPIAASLVQNTNVVLTALEPLATCIPHVVLVQGLVNPSGSLQYPNPLTNSFQVPLTLIENNPTHLWRYFEEGIDLGIGWRTKEYDDAAWKSGPGTLGVEDAEAMPLGWPIRTVLVGFGLAVDKPTVYFRTHFNLPTYPGSLTRFWLRDVVDDGCAVYLNGTLVLRQRLEYPFILSTFASPATEPHPVEGPFELPTDALRQGDNVLAFEVHQSSRQSADVVLGAELFAAVSLCGDGLTMIRISPRKAALHWREPSPYHLEESFTPRGPWASIPGPSGTVVDLGDGAARYFRLSAP